jgi:single-strand DNA-binding protein
MASLNKVILIGRMTADPELRYTQSEIPITEFRIAVDRPFKNASGEKTTDFFRCKAWRQTAEFVNNYLKKGRLVAVEGRIEVNEFTGQDGIKKYFTDIVCDNVQALDSARDREAGDGGYAAAPPAPAPRAAAPARSNPPAAQPAASAAEFDDFDDSDPFADE